ncbi:hypothetical protein [Deinococcus multiflagellatus]|uniref:Uncharacterized protein n=1 Tax=Deinococcus multiflagellatus TaxID=1656887 RepID=A0ABW1ZLE6_9DEIO|nr:hypothetical protein [Deinococcus multiflagellatus]MBZ9714197.1 hypothetical protein [Deinococcus multiflagellatus]
MRALLLSALLLATPAVAQSAAPAAPATPAPAAPAAAPTLLITAPVGTTVEQRLTMSSHALVKEVNIEALPGQRLSSQDIEKRRQGVMQALNQDHTPQTGKVFTRVTSRSADGRVGLMQTFIQNVPGQKEPVSFRITQTVTATGQSEGLKITSDNPVLSEVFSRMDLEGLQRMARDSGSAGVGYGVPLVPGQATEATIEMPTQGILAGLFGPVLGAQALLKANPMKILSRTTYTGLNAAGLHQFQTQSTFNDWRFELGEPLPVSAALLGASMTGTQTFRPDGLPGPSQTTTRMTMQMSMADDKARTTVTFEQEQTVKSESR